MDEADPQDFQPEEAVLDQSEIDKLLAMAEEEEAPNLIRADGKRGSKEEMSRVEVYDFRNPVFLTEIELRRLRILHEEFIRYLSARLSLMLRMDCSLKMSRLQTQIFEKFSDGLPNPTHICLFKIDPLAGVGVLDINPRLAITLVDRLLGGKGHSVTAERYLTEIEVVLLEDVIKVLLEEWCNQWKNEGDLHPGIIGHENNGRFLQTSPRDAVVLDLMIECSFGDCSESIQIGVPYYTIEPLVKSLQSRRAKDTEYSDETESVAWRPVYADVKVPVEARWQLPDVPVREIAALKVGDTLELPMSILEDTTVMLNNAPKFKGTVGVDDDHVAVKINQRITSADAEKAKAQPDG